jgi:hypothetical protein
MTAAGAFAAGWSGLAAAALAIGTRNSWHLLRDQENPSCRSHTERQIRAPGSVRRMVLVCTLAPWYVILLAVRGRMVRR